MFCCSTDKEILKNLILQSKRKWYLVALWTNKWTVILRKIQKIAQLRLNNVFEKPMEFLFFFKICCALFSAQFSLLKTNFDKTLKKSGLNSGNYLRHFCWIFGFEIVTSIFISRERGGKKSFLFSFFKWFLVTTQNQIFSIKKRFRYKLIRV